MAKVEIAHHGQFLISPLGLQKASADKLFQNICMRLMELTNSFSAELLKLDSSMFTSGRLHVHVITLQADSPESVLFAKISILHLALKELYEQTYNLNGDVLSSQQFTKF